MKRAEKVFRRLAQCEQQRKTGKNEKNVKKCLTCDEKNDMINPLLNEADFFQHSTNDWLNKVEKNRKKVLTGN